MLRTDELDYELPNELIATHPADRRDDARMMVLSRSEADRVEHQTIADLPNILEPTDTLFVNDTRVIPARLSGKRDDTGGQVEGLYLNTESRSTWRMMLKSNGRLRPGIIVFFENEDSPADPLRIRLVEKQDKEWMVAVLNEGADENDAEAILNAHGKTPLPPYILKARRDRHDESMSEAEDRLRYQTVYAGDRSGAVAAPTAGLHFTDELLEHCAARGIARMPITLEVGAGTFKPVDVAFVEEHSMHSEWFSIPGETLSLIKEIRKSSGRIVAVGTTTVRALESLSEGELERNTQQTIARSTNLLITPGFQFRFADVLLTNYHLPRSTLLALVGGFLGDLERLKSAYEEAIDEGYRFYSYGDCMLILP